MPLITVAYLCTLGGLLWGLHADIAWPLVGVAAVLAVAIALRQALMAACALIVAAAAIAAADARRDDTRCIAAGSRQVEWIATLGTPARPRSVVRGVWADPRCHVPVTVAISRGAAPAGALVRIRGQAVAGRRAVVIRDASVAWFGDGSRLPRWRARAGERIDRLFGTDAPVARALLIAEQRAIPSEIRDRYADAGLIHLLSVSGLHVAILAGAAQLLLAMLPIPRAAVQVTGIVLTAAYVALIGAPPAAVRAGGMLAAMALGRLLQRPTSPWALLSLGAIMPLANPRIAGDLGYQLSVAGMVAVVCAGLLARRIPSGWSPWKRKLGSELLTSVLAAALTGPLVAGVFGRLSLISPLANLAAAPLIALAQPALFLALVLSPAEPVALVAADGARVPLALLDVVARVSASVPYAAVPVAPRSVVCWLLLGSAAALALACASRHATRLVVGAVALAGAAAWWPLRGSGETELHILDVGQGDALAVRSARGRWILIDAGPAWTKGDAGRSTVVPYLRKLGGEVVALVLSHPHTDHVGGAATVLALLRPREVWEPAFDGTASSYRSALDTAHTRAIPWRHAVRGAELRVDEITVRFIAPDSAWLAQTSDPNDASAVALVQTGAVRFLLTGDAEAGAERRMLEQVGSVRADVLKLGHHGSVTSSTSPWLDAVQPRLALVSVGALNTYGHPGEAVLASLARRGVPVLRTDLQGTIVVRTNGHRITVETEDEAWDLSSGRAPR